MTTRRNPAISMADVLDAWDTIATFMNYERPSGRIEPFLRRHEIADDLDDWIENKINNVVDEYMQLTGLSQKAAVKELQNRRVLKPWCYGYGQKGIGVVRGGKVDHCPVCDAAFVKHGRSKIPLHREGESDRR